MRDEVPVEKLPVRKTACEKINNGENCQWKNYQWGKLHVKIVYKRVKEDKKYTAIFGYRF